MVVGVVAAAAAAVVVVPPANKMTTYILETKFLDMVKHYKIDLLNTPTWLLDHGIVSEKVDKVFEPCWCV